MQAWRDAHDHFRLEAAGRRALRNARLALLALAFAAAGCASQDVAPAASDAQPDTGINVHINGSEQFFGGVHATH